MERREPGERKKPEGGWAKNLIWGLLSLPAAVVFAAFRAVFLRDSETRRGLEPDAGTEPDTQDDTEPDTGTEPDTKNDTEPDGGTETDTQENDTKSDGAEGHDGPVDL